MCARAVTHVDTRNYTCVHTQLHMWTHAIAHVDTRNYTCGHTQLHMWAHARAHVDTRSYTYGHTHGHMWTHVITPVAGKWDQTPGNEWIEDISQRIHSFSSGLAQNRPVEETPGLLAHSVAGDLV